MVGDGPFAQFLDAVLSALVAAGRIRNGSQLSIDDLLSAMATPAPPGLPDGFDVSSTPERQLVERIRIAGGTLFLNRRQRREFSAQPPIAELRDFALAMIRADPVLPSSLNASVAAGAPDRRIVAVFFTLVHLPRLAEMVSRRRGLVYWLETHAGLVALKGFLSRAQARPIENRRHTLFRQLRSSRNRLTDIVSDERRPPTGNDVVRTAGDFSFAHQLFIEKQLTALLEQRLEWRNLLKDVTVLAVRPPNAAEIALYNRWQTLGEAVRDSQTNVSEHEARWEEIRARHRQSEQPERGRIYDEEIVPARRIRRLLRNAVGALRQQRRALRISRETRERVERYLVAQRNGTRNAALAGTRDTMLQSLDTRLGLTAPHNLMRTDEGERWQAYEAVLEELTDEKSTELNTHNFSFCFLAACKHTELERDIGMRREDQAEFKWITRPGHAREAVDMNGPRRDLTIARPDRFVVPDRFDLPGTLVRDAQHRETRLIEAVQPNERRDVFTKLATGLLGRRRLQSRSLDDFFERHGGDRIAPREVRGQSFGQRPLELIITALFAENLTAVNNLAALRARRARLARRIEAEITAEVGLNASAELINRARADAGRSGRFSVANAQRNFASVSPAQMRAALRDILRRTSGASGDRLPLLDDLWRFLVELHNAGAELNTGSGSVKLLHLYQFTGGESLTVEVLYSHLFEVGRLGSASLVPGQFVGQVGTTGNAVNIHLHIEFEVRLGSRPLGHCYPHEFFPLRPPAAP